MAIRNGSVNFGISFIAPMLEFCSEQGWTFLEWTKKMNGLGGIKLDDLVSGRASDRDNPTLVIIEISQVLE